MALITAPIWKDTEYISTANSLTYSIQVDGITIFNGRAFKKPDAEYLVININRICQNHLSNELPLDFFSSSSYTYSYNYDAVKTFYLVDDSGNTLQDYKFFYDWSYDLANSGVTFIPPINNHRTFGMFGLGTTRVVSATFNYYLNAAQKENNVTKYCGEYAIYYLDSNGCWQGFLFEGKCRKFDNYKQYEYNKSFNNTTIEFEQGRYISEINTVYELSTGWLNDTESSLFARDLVGTNMAYLHNLSTDKVFPILIDESSVEYKKYKNDRQLVEYTIRVKESQNKIRR